MRSWGAVELHWEETFLTPGAELVVEGCVAHAEVTVVVSNEAR